MTFRKGQSGNPAGRKPGTGRLTPLREKIARDLPEILAALAVEAKQGNPQAAKLLLERTLPPLRPEARPPQGATPTDPQGILSAVGAGTLTLEQGEALMNLAATAARISELVEIEARLKALETLAGR